MTGNPPASYRDWQATVPETVHRGPLWQLAFYKRALFLYDLCWYDSESWLTDTRGKAIANQVIRSCGSISANIEEGYGRGFGWDYARFLSIAVGSARETQGWYLRSHHLIDPDVLNHRLRLCDEIIGSLVKTIAYQRHQHRT